MFRDHFLRVRTQIIFLPVRSVGYTVVSCTAPE